MRSSGPHPAFVFAIIFVAIFLLHAPLLQLPYFWDEAGYYVPAARDLLLSGSLIPHTTVSNAHPPLVMAWIALWWKCVGYAPLVTRSAMLMLAAFSLLGVFRLAERVANTQVAIASTVCTALYPVFFAQSSLAQVDLAAAGLTFWGLCAYVEERPVAVAIWFSLAALAKETAILAPAALACWEVLRLLAPKWAALRGLWSDADSERGLRFASRILPLLVPLVPLALWYAYHYARTGFVFGNPEFFRYNVAATLSPLRFVLALGLRLWQAFGYLHLWLLTLGMLVAMLWPAVKDGGVERPRIAIPVQMIFLAVVKVYVIAMALIGGAVLARYMLTAVPLVIIVAVSTLRRRLRYWTFAVAVVAVAFVAAWFWNPPYGFSPEDNLAYRDYIVLHQDGERFLEARFPMAHVLTAWPASDELTRPWLGYTTRPMQVVRIEDFSLDEVLSAADFRSHFEVALVFSTKYEPAHPLLDRWKRWEELKRRYFGFHRDLPPEAMARILGGRVVWSEERKGQWVAVIEMELVEEAGAVDSGLRAQGTSAGEVVPLQSEAMTVHLFPAERHPVDPSLCFVLMPFSPAFSSVYAEIKKVVEEYAGFRCLRADELALPTKITDDIWTYIQQSRFAIADITGSNANVFYELGLCHALDKPVILPVQKGGDIPFDLKNIRYLEYSIADFPSFRSGLETQIRACLVSTPKTWNKASSSDGAAVRISSVEAPASTSVGKPIQITIKAKNFGLHASEAYFSLSFPSGVSSATVVKSDLPQTKTGVKGGRWKSGQVILDYPIAEASVYGVASPPWRTNESHYLTVEVTPQRPGLLQFYVAASAKTAGQPFVNDPRSASLLDQRDEPVYCGVVEIR